MSASVTPSDGVFPIEGGAGATRVASGKPFCPVEFAKQRSGGEPADAWVLGNSGQAGEAPQVTDSENVIPLVIRVGGRSS
jgi:hypothetical protein